MDIAQIMTMDDLGRVIAKEMIKLQNNEVDVGHAKAMACLAGRVISILRMHLEIYRLNGHKLDPQSCFLDIAKMLNAEVAKFKSKSRPKIRRSNGVIVHRN